MGIGIYAFLTVGGCFKAGWKIKAAFADCAQFMRWGEKIGSYFVRSEKKLKKNVL